MWEAVNSMSIYNEKPTDWTQHEKAEPTASPVPKGFKYSAKQMLCPNPNCGYKGNALRRAKGSRLALWLLLLMFVVPGLIYAMFFSGQVYCCPRCRMVVDLG